MKRDKTKIKNDDQSALRDEYPVQARRYVKYHEEIVTCSMDYHDNIDGDNKIKISRHLD